MTRIFPLLATFVLLLFLGGCASTSQEAQEPAVTKNGAAKSKAPVLSKTARIFIDGDEKGTTPATVTVRRGFGESRVVLRQGLTLVRAFELERVYTSNGADLVYSFSGDNSSGETIYDLQELSQHKDGTYIIPFLGNSILIEDREFGLTLRIQN